MSHEAYAIYFFRLLVESFIAHPDALRVHAASGGNMVKVTPECDSRDFGRIVGDNGGTYRNLRMLMGLAGNRKGTQFYLQRMPPTAGPREFQTPARQKKDWSKADTLRVEETLRKILTGILSNGFVITANGDTARTTFRVKIDDNEPLLIKHEELIEAISRICNAIGKTQGRDISVTSA